jgi:hypothetical protein
VLPRPSPRDNERAEARRSLEKKAGIVVLDRSIFLKMGIPLSELPAQAIIWSNDRDFVATARRQGLAAVGKGSLDELMILLREVYPADGRDAA